jgi:hypothetical protein
LFGVSAIEVVGAKVSIRLLILDHVEYDHQNVWSTATMARFFLLRSPSGETVPTNFRRLGLHSAGHPLKWKAVSQNSSESEMENRHATSPALYSVDDDVRERQSGPKREAAADAFRVRGS